MTAIPASSYTSRVLVDGTLALTVHIDPRHRLEAQTLFSEPGTQMALARLKTDSEAVKDTVKDTVKDKPLWSSWLAMRCKEPEFHMWLLSRYPLVRPHDGSDAGTMVRSICEVQSRAEIDTDPAAAERFQERIRKPWAEFNRGRT